MEYLLNFTIEHHGCNSVERLTTKLTLKVELDEERVNKDLPFIEVDDYVDKDNNPCSSTFLYVKSYELVELHENAYTHSCLELRAHGIGVEFRLQKGTVLRVGYPKIVIQD